MEHGEQAKELVDFIESKCLEKDEVLGNELGTAIRERFENLNLKIDFGGLRRFIAEHCAGKVVYVRPKGGDGVYAHVSKAGIKTEPGAQTISAWAAFIDPHVQAEVSVDSSSGHLLTSWPDHPIAEGLLKISKLNASEHRAIADGFLTSIPEGERAPFVKALQSADFWTEWTRVFRESRDSALFNKWMRWRHEQLSMLFEQRLRNAGLAESIVPAAVSEFNRSKPVRTAPSAQAQSLRTPPASLAPLEIHEIAHRAIELMSDAEIRSIWLPLGVVVDAFRRVRR